MLNDFIVVPLHYLLSYLSIPVFQSPDDKTLTHNVKYIVIKAFKSEVIFVGN